ncbi:hypothetical protein GCM10025865_30730 [Paraoerskovia sediminicola]|uniref:DNA repair protein RecN n=1 Tax=Paraoerskovia sediminicola TaxID=1138587 RepID=A0ABN6XFY3_9CELL|nr:hypothetical protein GCM10025865_30730 [Paraoerskovia sediminicola]
MPQALLADVADELVTVHGQADQARLRTPSRQRAALDAFAGSAHADLLARYRDAWTERAALLRRIDDVTSRVDERAREAELLRAGTAEIERVDPQPGEDDTLRQVVARLGNAEELREAARLAHDALVGDDTGSEDASALPAVDRARRSLEVAATTDPALVELARRVADAEYALQDVATDLAAYEGGLAADPGVLEQSHARLAELTSLVRTYGGDTTDTTDTSDGSETGALTGVAAVLAWARDAGLRLLELEDDDAGLEAMHARAKELQATIVDLAAALGRGRSAAADALAKAVTEELAGLAMSGASLEVGVERADEPGPWGADLVEMRLVPHPGAPARALGKGASGGELSRVMLAIEVALAAVAGAGSGSTTFVFDEVDAGVGAAPRSRSVAVSPCLRGTPRSSWSPTWHRSRRSPTASSWCPSPPTVRPATTGPRTTPW